MRPSSDERGVARGEIPTGGGGATHAQIERDEYDGSSDRAGREEEEGHLDEGQKLTYQGETPNERAWSAL